VAIDRRAMQERWMHLDNSTYDSSLLVIINFLDPPILARLYKGHACLLVTWHADSDALLHLLAVLH